MNEQQLKEDGGHQEFDEAQKQEVEAQWVRKEAKRAGLVSKQGIESRSICSKTP